MPEPIDPADLSGYRPLPGRGNFDYFDPQTGEHWPGTWWYNPEVYGENRIVSPSRLRRAASGMTPAERRVMGQARARRTRQATARTNEMFRDRVVGQQVVEALDDTVRNRDLLAQRDMYSFWARQYSFGDPRRDAIIAPGGPLARILEELGFRPPNAPWIVGASDPEVLAQWRVSGTWRAVV
jgi:hypothetical protein